MSLTAGRCTVIGRTYLKHGRPVTIVIRWGPGGGPWNVLIRRANGHLVVRPFRRFRKPSARNGTTIEQFRNDELAEAFGCPRGHSAPG